VPTILYHNAGFASLRQCKEIDGVEPRFDPAVIPTPLSGQELPPGYPASVDAVKSLLSREMKGGFYSILDFYNAYRSGRLTPTDVVEALLPLIRRDVASRSEHSTAFIDSKVEVVRKAAEESSRRWREGKPLSMLDGVPFAVKDEMDVKGYKRFVGTTKDHTNGGAAESSWCVRMLEETGAVMIGKTNMHEIGMGECKVFQSNIRC
jgi:hypothetical protein